MEQFWSIMAWRELWHSGGWLLIPLGLLALTSWISVLRTWWNLRACRIELSRKSSPVSKAWEDFVTSGGSDPEVRRRQAELLRLSGLERFDRALEFNAVLVAAAPLTGLLGTVLGMVTTFLGLGGGGTGSPIDEVSRGISQALITTQIGLLVAIPGTMWLALAHRNRRHLERDWIGWSQPLCREGVTEEQTA